MDIQQLADRYLQPYKTNNNRNGIQILPRLCPFCHGGEKHKDHHSFAMALETGVYNCKRGKCGAKGSFRDLLNLFGEKTDIEENNYQGNHKTNKIKNIKKEYKKPKEKLNELSTQATKYIQKRKISIETALRFLVSSDKKGNIIFPFCNNNNDPELIKYRPSKKVKKGENKTWIESGGKPCLFGLQLTTVENPLIITEGEFDTLAIAEALGDEANVVSVPFGCKDYSWIEHNWEKLKEFKKIILWTDNDEPGIEFRENIIKRLGRGRCFYCVGSKKDANEELFYNGKEKVKEVIKNAIPAPISEIVNIADVKYIDETKIERVSSGFAEVDKILGGFAMGEMTVWTGINSSGKSTMLGQILLEAIEHNKKVCAFSGELPLAKFKSWIFSQATGPERLIEKYDKFLERNVGIISKEDWKKLNKWYDGKLFLYDSSIGVVRGADLLKVFEDIYMQRGCKVFLIDNLMLLRYSDNASDFYRKQSDFLAEVKGLTRRLPIHIHLVAHPRKITGRIINKMDVAGTGDITNISDNVVGFHRVTNEEKQAGREADNLLIVFKNRSNGLQEKTIDLKFDLFGKRFSDSLIFHNSKEYGWVNAEIEEQKKIKEKVTPF